MKSFVTTAFDKGMKAMQNIKEGVKTGLHDSNLLFTGQEKKAAQKRLSEDFTVQQSQVSNTQISANKQDLDHQQIRSEHQQVDSKRDSEDLLEDGVDSEMRKQILEDRINKQLNFNDDEEDKNNKKSGTDSDDDSSDDSADSNKDKKSESDDDSEDDGDDDDDDSDLSEGARKKILADLDKDDDDEDDDNDDDSDNSDSLDDNSNPGKDSADDQANTSLLTDDIANRSLNAEDEDALVVIDKENYLKYVSEKYSMQSDVLEVVDKNERSFKQVAERLIQQTSYLTQPLSEVGISLQAKQQLSQQQQDDSHGAPISRRLILTKHLATISTRYHGDLKASQGVPYCLGASEQYLAVGSSDGCVRIFDSHERELKVLPDKSGGSGKANAVMCLDIQRSRYGNIFIVIGHSKGQITLHEVKGLRPYQEIQPNQVTSKHHKTVSDIHSQSIVSVKFVGELGPGIQSLTTVSCDLDGIVYICLFQEGLMSYQCKKQCFMKKKVGPCFSISPLLQYSMQSVDEIIQEQLQNQIQNGGSSTEIDFSRKKPQLVAFGALERIIIAQIRPQPKEILTIDRPDYIEIGTVPYLDWGLSLTPCFRDKSYPTLAIAWGKVLQLTIYVNFDQPNGQVQEPPMLQYDGYYVCEHTIDACYFLSESILFVIVNKQEVRILYTQNFTPGIFDDTYQLNDPNRTKSASELLDPMKRTQYFMKLKERFSANISSQYAEKDKGYRLLQEGIRFRDQISPATQQKSKFNSNPSMCKNFDNMVFALGKTSVGQGRLLHWEEYLNIIRKTYPDDWLKDLRASLDIFNGKLIGLAGLPDQKETREHMLRERMKDLLRKNINACIKEFQEGECISNKTLRVAVEFCIRVNAIEHLFGELFQMFAEAGMEQRFFENLEPFILSGKFKQTKIPEQILIRLIGYQRQKDLELLEKTILNIDLSKYSCILEVRHICETELLTSALIHILINEFDDDRESTVCLQLLCSLYNMKKKSKNQKLSRQEVFKLLNYDPLEKDNKFKIIDEEMKTSERTSTSTTNSNQNQKDNSVNTITGAISKIQKIEIEQSATYIGYKLMWVIKLFLEGKKFPQGTLSAFKWRIYVYDIVRFATNEEFLNWSLEFDPDTFFKLMKALFIEQEPFEYIQSQKVFIEMYKDQINGLDECMTHIQIVNTLHQAVLKFIDNDKQFNNGFLSSRGECTLNSFINFVAQISKKQQVELPESLCIYVAQEKLKFSKKLLKIPNILNEEVTKVPQLNSKLNPKTKADKMTRIYNQLIKKIEKDVISLLSRCEKDLDDVDLKFLLKDAERSPMYRVRVKIQELLGNYDECLTMFFKIPAIREDVFSWLQEVSKSVNHSNVTTNQMHDKDYGQDSIELQLKKLIMSSIPKFVEMDSLSTIKLAETWLDQDHQFVINRLSDNEDLIFKYLSVLLDIKEQEIESEYNQLMISGFRQQSKQYQQSQILIKKFVKTLCNKKHRPVLAEYVKKKYYPIDDCLQVIQETIEQENHDINHKKSKKLKEDLKEALAILFMRKGEYEQSVDLFIKVLVDLAEAEVVHALYLNEKISFNTNQSQDPHILRYDAILSQILNICEKYGSRLPEQDQEHLWLHSIKGVYKILQTVAERGGSSLGQKYLDKFQTFQNIRIQELMRRMSEHLKLERILEFLEDVGHPIKYQEFRLTFEDKVRTELHHENILTNAKQLLVKDLLSDTINLKNLYSRGSSNSKQKCDYCKRDLQYKWDIQQVCIFICGHVFHHRCVSNTEYKCMLCFNEFDQIQAIINKRGIRRTALKKGGNDEDNLENEPQRSVKQRKGSKNLGQGKDKIQQNNQAKNANSQLINSQIKNQMYEELSRQMYRFDSILDENIIHISDF